MTPARSLAATAVLAVLACGVVACSGSSESSTTGSTPATSGTSAQAEPAAATEPLVLRLGTADGPEAPSAEMIQHLASEVDTLSDGSITIRPVWNAEGEGVPRWDQVVAKLVMDGHVDLGVVPSRAWDELGVSSLRALTTPFLITDDEVAAEVVQGPLADRLMSGLDAVGVEGLALYPEGLRHPFGYTRALRGPGDYAGGTIRAAFSRTTYALFDALGATAVDDEPDPTTQVGAESSYRLTPAGTATGNVTFFPKVNALVINAGVRATLTHEQWGILTEAAGETRDWVVDTLPTDAQAAAAYCQETGKIAAATPGQVAALESAAAPVVADLRRDATTAGLIDDISRLTEASDAPAPVTACTDHVSDKASELNGVYTFTLTADAEREGGVSDQGDIDENAGDFTATFADGTWNLAQVYSTGPHVGQTWHGTGGYTYSAGHLRWFWGHESGQWTDADVTISDDGSLTFSNVDDGGPSAEAQALSDVTFTTWTRTDG